MIGLTAAIAVAERGASVTLIGESRPGEASPAAAGMLAPSVERAVGPAHDFGIAARDRYPSYIEFLAERTGIRVPLNRRGILQVALSRNGIKGLRKTAPPTARWIDSKALRELEPALAHAVGAMFNPDDGAVDNILLLAALSKLVVTNALIVMVSDSVTDIDPRESSATIRTRSDATHSARYVVLAAGAWVSRISGARLGNAVEPSRGQLLTQ